MLISLFALVIISFSFWCRVVD